MLSIILPTYNERESVLTTIAAIRKYIPQEQPYEIIVSDDNSPDKTWKLIKETFAKDKQVWCLRRMKNKGLSPAVIDAFKHAKGDIFLVTDADGQHDETIIPHMLAAIKKADAVSGTRFKKGGSVKGWSAKRILMSKTAAALSQPFLKQKISDPMSGFFMIRRKAFEHVKEKINPKGYKIYLEILFANKNLQVKEIPYKFKTRKKGASKLGSKVIVEYLIMLAKQFFKGKFFKFCVVGGSGVIVNMSLLYTLTEFGGLYYLLSAAIAIEISIITNFLLNNFWTWKKQNTKHSFWQKMLRFNLVSLIALIVNMGLLFAFTELIGLWYIISNLMGILAATIINYALNDKWTFQEK
ncbi:glycosyltransferase family 2 protein [Candidatus Woesearchaeota archaeon]|nr:glycosyltransferase family 2 protein [Candidatus Woesearchaeota archaeon]